MNNMKKKENLTVFYDGLCQLCSREIEHYKRQAGASQIDFVDICAPGFDAAKEGLDPFAIHKVMHVRRPDGKLVTRVQAFAEIWERLPRYRRLAPLSRLPGVAQALDLGYSAFAKLRPFLPRRKQNSDCSQSPYCEVKSGS